MSTPFFDLIEELRALGGDPKVTYPSGSTSFPQTERTIKCDRGSQILSFQAAEPNATRFPNCILTDQIELRSDAQVCEVYRKYETIPGSWTYSTSLSEDSEIVTVAKRKNLIANITDGESNSGETLTKTTHEGINDFLATETIETRPLPGLVLTEYEQERETQGLITRTWQIVATPVSAPSPTPGIIVKVEKRDAYNSWLITETRSTPGGWSEQDNGAYSFPTLFDYTGYTYTDACGAFADNRDGFSTNAQILKDVSFGAFTSFTGLQLIPKTLQLGRAIQFNGILVDSGSLTYSGSCTGTVSFGASSPSYSGYMALIGSSQLVGGSSKKTEWGDFRTERIYVTMI